MRAPLEAGAVFAGDDLPVVRDPFHRCEDMNLNLQFLVRRDGWKAVIVVCGGDGEPRDALGECEGMVKAARAAAQGAFRIQGDKGPPALQEGGFGQLLRVSRLPGAAIVVERVAGAGEQRGLIGCIEAVRGRPEVAEGAVADRVLVAVRDGARSGVIESLLKRLAVEAAQGFEQEAYGFGSADGGAGAVQLVDKEGRVEAAGGGNHSAIQGSQFLRGGCVEFERDVPEIGAIVREVGTGDQDRVGVDQSAQGVRGGAPLLTGEAADVQRYESGMRHESL